VPRRDRRDRAASAGAHLGIETREYDARIATFIPGYQTMLRAAARALKGRAARASTLVDLGVGSGALAAACLAVAPGARVVGIDRDRAMLAMARTRLGSALAARVGDFERARLPRADVIVAAFALHHVPTPARKARLYGRLFASLRPGGLFVNADCCLADDARRQAADRRRWRAHLAARYGGAEADRYLAEWGREDMYLPLSEEVSLLRDAGFGVRVAWRRGSFAVLAARKPRARA
jgi:tRNA (cmo5U34)-methyltransferase